MTVSDIQKALTYKFDNHKYDLCNSYIFNDWECDFFSVTASGYYYEVEIKLSRSDFLKDFDKWKHKIFNAMHSGNQFYVRNLGNGFDYNSRLFLYKYKTLICSGYRHQKNLPEGVIYDYGKKCYITNCWDKYLLHEHTVPVYPPCTKIKIYNLNEINCPNRFFYAVPEGLIKKQEVPRYAGLIYVNEHHQTEIIKQAPFLHKRNQDLKHILLEKFYWECKNLRKKIEFNL
jgi:hypothetical protein